MMEQLSDPSNFFNSLGESLSVEIFCRLPSRAALRLKLVCKRWYFLISSQYFIAFFNHRRHDPSLPPLDDHDSLSYSLVFQFEYSRDNFCSSLVRCRYTRSNNNNNNAAKLHAHHMLDLSFLPCPQTKIELRASCDDLILCSFKKQPASPSTFFYICNLQTKQWLALPPAPSFKEQSVGLLCVPVPSPCSLCHRQCVDNSHYKFMVVRIHRHDQLRVPQSKFKVQFFSSEEGQWTTRVVSSPRTLRGSNPNTCIGSNRSKTFNFLVAYKEMLHWLTFSCVLVFDPFNAPDTFSRAIDLSRTQLPTSIGVCRDRLCAVTFDHCDNKCAFQDIWELVDYNMGKWNLVHRGTMKPILENYMTIEKDTIGVLYVHPDGNVVYDKILSIWLYNLQCEKMDQQYNLIKSTTGFNLFAPTNILHIVDQWWPTPIPSLPLNLQHH